MVAFFKISMGKNSIAGGYIVQIVSANAIKPGRKKIEASMQKLHDQGKWTWVETRIIEKYGIPSLEEEDGGETGLQFIFRII